MPPPPLGGIPPFGGPLSGGALAEGYTWGGTVACAEGVLAGAIACANIVLGGMPPLGTS